MALVELKGIRKTYERTGVAVEALADISLTVNVGEFVTVWGPSGSGKSTLLNILGMLDRPTTGDYRFSETAVNYREEETLAKLRARHIGVVFQSFNLLPNLKAWQNVALPAKFLGRSKPQETKQRALELLERVGLAGRSDHYPSELSGGEEQRVAIARALMNEPELILADEPTGNLDSMNHTQVLNILKDLSKHQTTVIVVSHNPDFIRQSDQVVQLRDGRIVI